MINIQIDTNAIDKIRDKLNNLGLQMSNLEPLHKEIANEILNITEQSFHDEKDPWGNTWEPRSENTQVKRSKILRLTPSLYRSFTIDGTNDRAARVSTEKIYAAIHQFGGKAGRKSNPVTIPKRPFFPVDNDGNMPDATVDAVVEKIEEFIESGL